MGGMDWLMCKTWSTYRTALNNATIDIVFVCLIFGFLYYCIVNIGRRAIGSSPCQDLSTWCSYLECVFIRKPCATHYIKNSHGHVL